MLSSLGTAKISIQHLSMSTCNDVITGKVPVTVVVAGDVIYLAQENFHHWPLPRLQELPPKEALDPPFSSVEQKDITDIEQIVSHNSKEQTSVLSCSLSLSPSLSPHRQWIQTRHAELC